MIPKKLKYRGFTWKIKMVEGGGGWYDYNFEGGPTIGIGKDQPVIAQQETLLHEITEMLMMDHYVRYHPEEGSAALLFVFDHTKLCSIVADLLAVLKENNLGFQD